MKDVVRVVVVDDSAVAREFIKELLNSDPRITVVGTATDGLDAIRAVEKLSPDVVTMDINMPRMNGYEATRRIMETMPTRIVVVSATPSVYDAAKSFEALEAGALAVLRTPPGPGDPRHQELSDKLRQTVRLMSEVQVVRRWPRKQERANRDGESGPGEVKQCKLVVIGSSTGGPLALRNFLGQLARPVVVPIIVVQHMANGFIGGFIEWLQRSIDLHICRAKHGEKLAPGVVYVAGEDECVCVTSRGTLEVIDACPRHQARPSVSHLFETVAEHYKGAAIAVLLSGMGRDGSVEMKRIQESGSVTMVQDEATSTIFGMPGSAIALGGVDVVDSPERLAARVNEALADRRRAYEGT